MVLQCVCLMLQIHYWRVGEKRSREKKGDRRREIKRGWSCVEKISEERKKVKVKREQGEERQEMKQG